MLAKIQEEACLADIDPQRSRVAERVCRKLAAVDKYPVRTAEAFIHHKLPSAWLNPILFKAVTENHPGRLSLMNRCLSNGMYQEIAVSVAITLPEPSQDFLTPTIALAEKFLPLIHDLCSLGRVPEETLQVLLSSDSPGVACAAAVGHWRAVQKGIMELVDKKMWRQAILLSMEVDSMPSHHTSYEYELHEILASDSDLSEAWLVLGLAKGGRWFRLHSDDFIVQSVISTLDTSRRRKVLEALPLSWNQATHTVVRELVGQDLGLYHGLLNSKEQFEYHLSPLMGKPNRDWWTKAALALDAGYSVVSVVRATQKGGVRAWTGTESEMWAEWARCL